jgi:hypothetical protein
MIRFLSLKCLRNSKIRQKTRSTKGKSLNKTFISKMMIYGDWEADLLYFSRTFTVFHGCILTVRMETFSSKTSPQDTGMQLHYKYRHFESFLQQFMLSLKLLSCLTISYFHSELRVEHVLSSKQENYFTIRHVTGLELP